MARKLPTVDILGTAFCVDVCQDGLWQKDNPQNRISFNVFDREGNGYTFLYDTLTRTAPEDKSEITEMGERYQWVTLPALMELDPVGIALKYDIPLSVLCPELVLEEPEQLNEDDEEWN